MSSFALVRRSDTINLYRSGAAAKLELNRPDRLNALSSQLMAELLTLLQEAGDDPSVRSVLITGAGRAFSSGNDMRQPAQGDSQVRDLLRERYHPMIRTMRRMPKPVISAANGPVAGAGNALALSADIVLAAESAYFLLAHVNIGVLPTGARSRSSRRGWDSPAPRRWPCWASGSARPGPWTGA
jgi:2-(1,2-epoxy-1,2-dihydrophenyl)acetyl-CoA isomerase